MTARRPVVLDEVSASLVLSNWWRAEDHRNPQGAPVLLVQILDDGPAYRSMGELSVMRLGLKRGRVGAAAIAAHIHVPAGRRGRR